MDKLQFFIDGYKTLEENRLKYIELGIDTNIIDVERKRIKEEITLILNN